MNKTLSIVLAVICFVASAVMYFVGSESSHLSELLDFFYLPLPLGLFALIIAIKKNKQS